MPDHTPTFADLCSAIADGRVIATLDGSVYEVNAFEFRRYFNRSRLLPGVSSLQSPSFENDGDTMDTQPPRPVQKH